jgi:hypothetical protein
MGRSSGPEVKRGRSGQFLTVQHRQTRLAGNLHLLLVLDVDELLRASGRVGDVELHGGFLMVRKRSAAILKVRVSVRPSEHGCQASQHPARPASQPASDPSHPSQQVSLFSPNYLPAKVTLGFGQINC